MHWWKTAIYDTCSLITLDHLFQEEAAISQHFPGKSLALEASLCADQMYKATAARVQKWVEIIELPPPGALAGILAQASLPKSLADVDQLVYATAVHGGISVVTGDKRLGKAVQKQRLKVGDMAAILKELVQSKDLTKAGAVLLLQKLAIRKDYLLGKPIPTWTDLERHTFPG